MMNLTDHSDERERLHRAISECRTIIATCPHTGRCRTCDKQREYIAEFEGAIAALDSDEQPAKVIDPYLPYLLDKAGKIAERDPEFLADIIAAKAAFAEQLTSLMDEHRAKDPVPNLLWSATSVGDQLHGVRDSGRDGD